MTLKDSAEFPKRRLGSYLPWLIASLAIGIVTVAISLPIREGLRHQRLADELVAMGCFVEWSHHQRVSIESTSSDGPVSLSHDQSTIPILDMFRLSPMLRRVNRVVLRYKTDAEFQAILAVLHELQTIENISINESIMNADQLEQLTAAIDCRTLFVQQAKLPRDSLPFLRNEPLTFLYLGRSQFSNPAIADLPNTLVHFDATRTRISDEGLKDFVRFTNLKSLKLSRTPTTEAGIRSLRQQMPWCIIRWEPLKR